MLSREELLKMVAEAHEACYHEYMWCPWCTGHIGHENDHHDDWCEWLIVKEELDKKDDQ